VNAGAWPGREHPVDQIDDGYLATGEESQDGHGDQTGQQLVGFPDLTTDHCQS
jgi:hypothetical protein